MESEKNKEKIYENTNVNNTIVHVYTHFLNMHNII